MLRLFSGCTVATAAVTTQAELDRANAKASHLRNRATRHDALKRDRAFSTAFARQVSVLSKRVQKAQLAERRAADGSAERIVRLRAEEAQRNLNVKLLKEQRIATNHAIAADVRADGFDDAVATAYASLAAEQREWVQLVRYQLRLMRERLGPPGGAWGSRHSSLLRQPAPMHMVVTENDVAVLAHQMAAGLLSNVSGQVPSPIWVMDYNGGGAGSDQQFQPGGEQRQQTSWWASLTADARAEKVSESRTKRPLFSWRHV